MKRIVDVASIPAAVLFAVLLAPGASYALGSHQTQAVSPQPTASNLFNVKTYGATGNGKTDDTAAIQAAITAANAGTNSVVFFPQGQYLFSTSLQGSHISMLGVAGGGSILLSSGGANININGSTSGTGVVVSNLNFQAIGTGTNPMLSMNVSNSEVTGNTFPPAFPRGVECNGVENVRIYNNTFNMGQTSGGYAIYGLNCSNLMVQSNSISGAHATAFTAITTTNSKGCQVIKNTLIGNPNDTTSVGIFDSGSSPTIQGNNINSFGSGVSVGSGNPTINLNTISNIYNNAIYTSEAGPTVSKNTISKVSVGSGIYIYKSNGDITILQNTIASTGGASIYAFQSYVISKQINIIGNAMVNAGLAGGTTQGVVYVDVIDGILFTIEANRYEGNTAGVQYFIYCKQPATVQGNKTKTTLPSYP